jgi:hypothetical protein
MGRKIAKFWAIVLPVATYEYAGKFKRGLGLTILSAVLFTFAGNFGIGANPTIYPVAFILAIVFFGFAVYIRLYMTFTAWEMANRLYPKVATATP